MSTKQTFTATCPFTGEIAKRKSAHEYTHALAVRRRPAYRAVLDAEGKEQCYRVTHRGQAPAGYVITSEVSSAMWGRAIKAELIPVEERGEFEVDGIISFHHSRELSAKAGQTWSRGGWYEIDAVHVPTSKV